jgi:hypothetical protein
VSLFDIALEFGSAATESCGNVAMAKETFFAGALTIAFREVASAKAAVCWYGVQQQVIVFRQLTKERVHSWRYLGVASDRAFEQRH